MSRLPEPLKVIAVRAKDADSGESTVEFETTTGQRFTCFAFCVEFAPGEVVTDAQFSLQDAKAGFEDLFSGNAAEKKGIENTGEWSCRAWGQVVALRGADPVVDCGGVLLPLANVTHDPAVVGSWVRFSVDRLDVFRDGRA